MDGSGPARRGASAVESVDYSVGDGAVSTEETDQEFFERAEKFSCRLVHVRDLSLMEQANAIDDNRVRHNWVIHPFGRSTKLDRKREEELAVRRARARSRGCGS